MTQDKHGFVPPRLVLDFPAELSGAMSRRYVKVCILILLRINNFLQMHYDYFFNFITILLLYTGFEYAIMLNNTEITCHEYYGLEGRRCSDCQETCENDCDNRKECNFFFVDGENCLLFESCDTFGNKSRGRAGFTYRKMRGNID